ncbi:MAG: hypothetical protein IPH07_38750 [Deltaproteobacteria bacterium]|nr:hypothetical protein [Deltaproteobacteria bacterium]MBK8713773.1 hypothetical protein [Deltaproteobacteria bacterium]MBP7290278.1 hypothetical protein [Nannocystaceae bacterium]
MAIGAWLCLSLSLQLATARAPGAGSAAAIGDPIEAATVVVGVDPRLGLSIDDVTVALRSHLAGTALVPDVRPLDGDALRDPTAWAEHRLHETPGARAVFWVVADDGIATLHLWLPGDAGAWARTLPDVDDRDAQTESIGVMVRGMATSIEAASTAVEPAVPPEPARVPVDESPTPTQVVAPPRSHVDVALGYLGSNLADRAPWQSAPALRAHLVHPSRATVALGLAWAPPQHAGDALTITRVGIDAAVGVTLRPGRRVRPSILIGGVIEAMGWELRGFGRGWGLRAAVTAGGGIDVALTARVGLTALARVDAWCRNATLVVDGPTGRERLLRGHPAAATAFLGIRVRLGGEFLHPRRPSARHGDR